MKTVACFNIGNKNSIQWENFNKLSQELIKLQDLYNSLYNKNYKIEIGSLFPTKTTIGFLVDNEFAYYLKKLYCYHHSTTNGLNKFKRSIFFLMTVFWYKFDIKDIREEILIAKILHEAWNIKSKIA